jgi:glycine/D-amino acid oxidase-like deaminating enzyme
MIKAQSAPSVVVVGAGIFGVSSALHLARLGASVTLVTEAAAASGASGRSLAWLNSARKRSAAYHGLRMAGIDRYRTLAARYPGVAWLRFDGGLTWDAADADNAMAAVHRHEREIGYDSRLLTAAQVGGVTPGVDTRAVPEQGAIFNPGEGWVDLPSLIHVLMGEYIALGGRFVPAAGHASVDVQNGRARGVKTEAAGYFAGDAVLLATGPAVPALVAEVGIHIPDMTPISLLVQTKPLDHSLRAVLNTPRVAIRRTPDGRFVLDKGWAEKEIVIRGDGSYEVKDSTVQRLLAEASAVLEGNPKLELDGYGVGPKPIPKDGEPVFGRLDSIPGYYVAFSHSGATLGLIAGEALASEIVTGEAHPLLATFSHTRFAEAPPV